jgi:hypothetical protein
MMNEDVVGGGAGISGVGQSLVLLIRRGRGAKTGRVRRGGVVAGSLWGNSDLSQDYFSNSFWTALTRDVRPFSSNPTNWNLISSLPTTTQRGINWVANLLRISRFGSAATAERPHPVNLVHPVLGENRRKLTDRMNRMNRIPGWRTKD